MGLMCIQTVLFAHLQEFSQPRVICSEQKLKPWGFHLLGSTFHLLRCSAASLGSRVTMCSIISGLCDQSFLMSKAFSSTSVMGRAQALLPTLAVEGPVLFVSPCAPWNAESQGRPRQSCCCPEEAVMHFQVFSLSKDRAGNCRLSVGSLCLCLSLWVEIYLVAFMY